MYQKSVKQIQPEISGETKMIDSKTADLYTEIIKEELIPAMGCTEPISLAYAAAAARKTLGALPERTTVTVSGNIIKNVKSVIVPHTGGMRGIETAAAIGFIGGNADKELEVLSDVTEKQISELRDYLKKAKFTVKQSESDRLFEIVIEAEAKGHTASVTLLDGHTNITEITKDGSVIFSAECLHKEKPKADRRMLSVKDIVSYAEETSLEGVKEILDRQIEYNTAIAREGLSGNWGASIGRIILKANGNSVGNRAKAWAAAGSDVRMNGCELPVVINSGSGNQGMTASLPVIVYAEELNVSKEQLYRALLISNLVTVHLKTGIGCLSAYCGAISAGCGAGAGITYLYGGRFTEIAHTIVNAVAINSGVVCDGAKASCAAKIASAVEAGLLGMNMYMHGREFYGGDGIVNSGIEETIENVAALARNGMRETDREILKIMLKQ